MSINLESFITEEFLQKCSEGLARRVQREDNRASRIHSHYPDDEKFKELIYKVLLKYKSAEYKRRYLHIEPPEGLLDVLVSYASRYGRDACVEECEEYGNMFTTELYFCRGFYFHRMCGQGSYCHIFRKL
jgi:hypothetical protein